jgi:hypothetical protein
MTVRREAASESIQSDRPSQKVQVMSDAEIAEKRRTPHFVFRGRPNIIVRSWGIFLAVKNSREIAAAIHAHFERLQKYHRQLLGLATDVEGDSDED